MHVSMRFRALITLMLIAVLLIVQSPVYAATVWFVAPTGDDQRDCQSPVTPCATIQGTLAKPGFTPSDSIRIAIGTYTGSNPLGIRPTKAVTLSGGWNATFTAQEGMSIIDGAGVRRGMTIATAIVVTLDHITIRHGVDTGGGGGAIYNELGTLTIRHSTLHDNVSRYPEASAIGGAIYNRGGTLTISDSTLQDNVSDFSGGAIMNTGGNMTIERTTIISNTVGDLCCNGGGGGGGILSLGGTLTINQSTISDNLLIGDYFGSAINLNEGEVRITNSTISGNMGGHEALYSFSGSLGMNNTTISGNTGIGIVNATAAITVANTIIANNSTADCLLDPTFHGSITSLGTNLVEHPGSCPFGGTDLLGLTPLLGPLRDNGGPTVTQALLSGSPAIDMGNPASCLLTDQRGARRVGVCDIGAYEAYGTIVTLTSLRNPSVVEQPVTFTAAVEAGEGGIPSGTITFHDGAAILGSIVLDSAGHATMTSAPLSSGRHSITATYTSNPPFSNSEAEPLIQIVLSQSLLPLVLR